MSTKISPGIAALPIFQDGVQHGTDIGLRIALDAITSERQHQERLGSQPDHPGSPACRVYADGALLTVAKTIAARFLR
jgi:hypothetical protein